MSKIITLQGREFDDPALIEFYEERPDCIQELMRKTPPDSFVINKDTNQLMEVISWFENGTIKAGVRQDLNTHLLNSMPSSDYAVFGIDPDDLAFYCFIDETEKLDAWVKSNAST